jgi:peptidyl-prolyl cis-trans isomerase B (cyclophilin B)
MKKLTTLLTLFTLATLPLLVVGCGQKSNLTDMIAIIETSHGVIKFDFYEEEAPELSKNFAELAKRGYYDSVIFHRVIHGFMIQGGDPEGTGMGGQSYKGEGLADEEGALKLKHKRGAVACAKSSRPNSIGSQFYIVHQPSHFLDGNYSVFGQVIEGIEVVDKIANIPTDSNDRPTEEVVMTKVYLQER